MNYQSPTTTKDRHMRYLILILAAMLAAGPAAAGYSSSGADDENSFCSMIWCDPVPMCASICEKFNN